MWGCGYDRSNQSCIFRYRTAAAVSDGSVSAGLASQLLELAVQRGASRDELLNRSALTLLDLVEADARIDLQRYIRLMRNAKTLTGDEALALHFGQQADLAEFSVLGGLRPSSGRPIDGLSQTNRFVQLLIDVPISGATRFELEERDDGLWVVDTRSDPNAFPELTESTFARKISTFRRNGAADAVREVRVTHPEPEYRSEYDDVFRVPITFNCQRNELRLNRAALEQVHAVPGYASSVLQQHAEALLSDLKQNETMRARVERILIRQISGSICIDAVAHEMGLSRQTLHRRLADEHATFEQIRDDLRKELALRTLRREKISPAQLAAILGFSDRSAFARAFKRWTGVGPSAWKRTALANS